MRHRTAAVAAVAFGAVLIAPASAQFGPIFGDAPPRPPAAVPGARTQPPPDYPPTDPGAYPPPQNRYPSQSGYPASPPQNYPSQSYPPGPGGSAVEARPLPAPGAAAIPPPPPTERPAQLPRPGLPPPADAAQTGDEVITEPSSQKIVNSAALFSGLDKISGRIINFDVAIGETVQFGALQLTPRACYTRPATEAANTDAFIEVDEVTLQGEVRRIFTGWVFAASPGLHAIEHPIYDLWLTDCKGPVETAEKQVDPPPAPAARTPQRPQQARQQPQRAPSARPQILPPPR